MKDCLDCIEYTLILKKQKVNLNNNTTKNIINPIQIKVSLVNAPYVPINDKLFIEQTLNTAFKKIKSKLFEQEKEDEE